MRLVERTTRALRLTPEGERFLQTCDAITSTWARGQSLLRQDARAVEGRIHIAAPTDTSAQFLAEWIGDYTRRIRALRSRCGSATACTTCRAKRWTSPSGTAS